MRTNGSAGGPAQRAEGAILINGGGPGPVFLPIKYADIANATCTYGARQAGTPALPACALAVVSRDGNKDLALLRTAKELPPSLCGLGPRGSLLIRGLTNGGQIPIIPLGIIYYVLSRARYGLKAMAVLAAGTPPTPPCPRRIVATEHIPAKYLESILTALRKRPAGQPPGPRLPPGAPARGDIACGRVRRWTGPSPPPPAPARDPVCCEGCDDMASCYIRPFMRRVRDEMAKVLEGQTVADLSASYCSPGDGADAAKARRHTN